MVQKTFTVSQLMERWQCTRDSVLSKIHAGRLQAFNVGRGNIKPRWRVLAAAVETYEQANESPAWNAPKTTRRKSVRPTREYV